MACVHQSRRRIWRMRVRIGVQISNVVVLVGSGRFQGHNNDWLVAGARTRLLLRTVVAGPLTGRHQ